MMMSLTRRLGRPVVATGLALALGIIPGVPAWAASAGGWQRVYRNSSKTQNILYGMTALSGTESVAGDGHHRAVRVAEHRVRDRADPGAAPGAGRVPAQHDQVGPG